MAWPPTLDQSAFFGDAAGNAHPTTLVWGTDGVSSSYNVVSVNYHKNNEMIPIPEGNGLIDTRVFIKQGRTTDITVVDKAAVAPPQPGTVITLIVPNVSGNTGQGNGKPIKFRVLNADFDGARKQEGHRIIRATRDTVIDAALV